MTTRGGFFDPPAVTASKKDLEPAEIAPELQFFEIFRTSFTSGE